jgi:hypothetical protein
VAKVYSQVKGLNFDETFAPIIRLESLCILLSYATHHGFMLYQIDVKIAFLNGPIKEEVYIEQSPDFEVKSTLTMFINSIRRSMNLSKDQEYGMNALGFFSMKIV